jgi:hypothetical protein
LRYKPPMPPEEVLALYKQYGIETSEKISATSAGDPPAATGGGSQADAGMQNSPRAPKTDTAVVWKLHPDNTMEPVRVSLGITDHSYTEVTSVLKGELKEGEEVIIRSVVPNAQVPGGIRR